MKKVGRKYIRRIPGMWMPILPVTTAGLLPWYKKEFRTDAAQMRDTTALPEI